MRKILILFLALIPLVSFGQTNTVVLNILNIYAEDDTLDLNSDNTQDLVIRSYFSVDHAEFDGISINNNVLSTYPAIQNQNFVYYFPNSLIAQSSIGCGWNTSWTPNTGLKYMGYRIVNSPGDTTFGYLKMEFRGNFSCVDTLFIYENTYSIVPNVHLTAGQLIAGINEMNFSTTGIYPNPCAGILHVDNGNEKISEITISNILGEVVYRSEIKNTDPEINVADKPNGIYFITIKTETDSFTRKVIIQK